MNMMLALYPNARGMGYACIQPPKRLIEAEVVTMKPACNRKLLARIERFIDFYRPRIIIVRDPESLGTSARRVGELIGRIVEMADEKGIEVHTYSREQIKDVFAVHEAHTKYEMAHKIIECIPELADRAPSIRKPWMDEPYHMGVFDAVALALTHLYLQ